LSRGPFLVVEGPLSCYLWAQPEAHKLGVLMTACLVELLYLGGETPRQTSPGLASSSRLGEGTEYHDAIKYSTDWYNEKHLPFEIVNTPPCVP
jgi:hypothetical protein